jgi:hypothetical protein
MKKIAMLVLLISIAFSASAQWYYKTYQVKSLDDLTQEQLNLSMEKYFHTIKTGKIMTITGAGLVAGGVALFLTGIFMSVENDLTLSYITGASGFLIAQGGFIVAGIGAGKWIVGSHRIKEIRVELVKFNGTESIINGIGLKICF